MTLGLAAPADPAIEEPNRAPGASRLRARVLVPLLIVASVIAAIVTAWAWPASVDRPDTAAPWPTAVGIALQSALILLLAARHAGRAGAGLGAALGPWRADLPVVWLAAASTATLGLAFVSTYAVFVPLSYLFPDGVRWWLFEDQPVAYSADLPSAAAGNLVAIFGVVVLGPVAEEWFFRGLLLRRWAYRWGPAHGVIWSSLLFGIAHSDPVGGFLFAVAACGVYAHYQSLWAPVILHMAHNGIATGLMMADAHGVLGSIQLESVADLRALWWLPVVGAVAATPWVWHAGRTWKSMSQWAPVR
jgi:membrane protease YdiL (CAAX protease family)